jgi:hypothetical protein
MTKSPQPFEVEFDTEKNGWSVKMPEGSILCHSEADAHCMASLPVVHAEASAHDLLDAEDRRKEAFCQTASRLVQLVNQYGARCLASRDVERAIMRVQDSLRT